MFREFAAPGQKWNFVSQTGDMMMKSLIGEDDREPDENLTPEELVTRLENGWPYRIRQCGRMTVRPCGAIHRAAFFLSP